MAVNFVLYIADLSEQSFNLLAVVTCLKVSINRFFVYCQKQGLLSFKLQTRNLVRLTNTQMTAGFSLRAVRIEQTDFGLYRTIVMIDKTEILKTVFVLQDNMGKLRHK